MTIVGYLIFYLICALNVFWGIKKKKSNALYAVAMIVVFILMTFNFRGPDIEVYRGTYDAVGESSSLHNAFAFTYMERGYTLLMFCANRIGLDFYAFRIILTFIGLSLFASTIRYYKVNPNFVIGLYMVYLFFFDTIQIRNFVIQFIILFATRYLFDKSVKSVLKYILCIAIAGSIHTLSLLYLSLLLVRLVKRKSGYKAIFTIAAFAFVICTVIQPILPQIVGALMAILNRGGSYAHGNLRFNSWIVLALSLLSFVPLYRYKSRVADNTVKEKIEVIIKIKVIMGLFLPLCFINSNFNRIFRNFIILDTIGLALLYANLKRHTTPSLVTLAAQLLLTCGWLVTDLIRNVNTNIIGTIIEKNLLFASLDAAKVLQYVIVMILCAAVIYAIKKISSDKRRQRERLLKCA